MTAVKPENVERNRRIVEMYGAGLTYSAIAAELRVMRNVVAGVVNRAGVANRGHDNTERNRRIVELYKNGLSFKSIAAQLGVNRDIVAGHIHRSGAADRGGARRPFADLTGKRFGRLLVLRRAANGACGQTRFTCLCDCGVTVDVRASNLQASRTSSCSCYGRSHPSNIRYTFAAREKAA